MVLVSAPTAVPTKNSVFFLKLQSSRDCHGLDTSGKETVKCEISKGLKNNSDQYYFLCYPNYALLSYLLYHPVHYQPSDSAFKSLQKYCALR